MYVCVFLTGFVLVSPIDRSIDNQHRTNINKTNSTTDGTDNHKSRLAAPLPSALRICERLYLRGGNRDGLLAGEL